MAERRRSAGTVAGAIGSTALPRLELQAAKPSHALNAVVEVWHSCIILSNLTLKTCPQEEQIGPHDGDGSTGANDVATKSKSFSLCGRAQGSTSGPPPFHAQPCMHPASQAIVVQKGSGTWAVAPWLHMCLGFHLDAGHPPTSRIACSKLRECAWEGKCGREWLAHLHPGLECNGAGQCELPASRACLVLGACGCKLQPGLIMCCAHHTGASGRRMLPHIKL